MTGDTRWACHNCGAELYAQWRDKTGGGYVCRRCGANTPGRALGSPSPESPASGSGAGAPGTAAPDARRPGLVLPVLLGLGAGILVFASDGSAPLAGLVGLLVFGVISGQRESSARLAELELRISDLVLQRSPPGAATVAPTPPAPRAEVTTPAPRAPVRKAPGAPPVPLPDPGFVSPFAPVQPAPPSVVGAAVARLRTASTAELEELVAGRVLPIVGGVALLAAAILFLGLAFARGWIGEEGRVLIGLAAGTATYGLGALVLFRGQPLIGQVLVGVGLGVFSLAVFGATQLYELVPAELGLLAALIADLSAAAIAVRAKSQVVAGLGLITVLVAPPLTGAEPTLVTVLFLGVALVATTAIAIAESWRWLPSLAFVLTAPQLASYALGLPDPVQAVPVLLAFGALNAIAAAGEEWRTPRRELSPSSATLLAASAGFVVWALLTVLVDETAWWEGILVAAFGIGHLALGGRFLYRDGDRHPFGMLAVGTGIVAVTMAVPLQLGGVPVPMIWAAEALALTWVYVRRRHALAGLAAVIVGLLVVAHLVLIEYPPADLVAAGLNRRAELLPYANAAGLALGWTLAVGLAALVMLRTTIERSYVGAALLLLVTWTLPYEFGGVTLVWLYGLVAVIASAARWRWIHVRVEDAFPLVWRAKAWAPRALELVIVAAGLIGYSLAVTTLPLSDLFMIVSGDRSLPATPFTDAGTAMVLGLVVTGLAVGLIGELNAWRAGAVILAAGTIAYLLPFELPGSWVVIGWCLLAGGILALDRWVMHDRALGYAADGLGFLAAVVWLVFVLPPIALAAGPNPQTPLLNVETLAGVALIAALAFRGWAEPDRRWRLAIGGTAGILAVYLVSVVVIDVVEVLAVGAADVAYIGQVSLSVCWAALGVGILVAGLVLRSLPVRAFGLALLGLATFKVFVFDLANVDIAFRVLSFVGLGLLLIGAGWIYLRLQGRTTDLPVAGGGDER